MICTVSETSSKRCLRLQACLPASCQALQRLCAVRCQGEGSLLDLAQLEGAVVVKVLMQYVEALETTQLSFRMLQNAEHTRLPLLSTTGSCEKRACWSCSSTCCGESLVCTVCTLLQAGRAALRQTAQGVKWRPRCTWQPACLSQQLSAGL